MKEPNRELKTVRHAVAFIPRGAFHVVLCTVQSFGDGDVLTVPSLAFRRAEDYPR